MLQGLGWVGPLVTQNVDRLHSRAGYRDVLELHGTTHRCLGLPWPLCCCLVADRILHPRPLGPSSAA